jgi:hypothetical protein
MKYRKKPVVIEAIQWTGENTADIDTFTESNFVEVARGGIKMLEIYTLEGTMKAHINDYIIKGVQGEFYPCKPKIFEETYEVVE